MKTFSTQEEFLKEFPITDATINCRNESFELRFDLSVEANICNARDIKAWDINARDINAWDINARDINARDIKACSIYFYAVCFAYNDILCTSIKGNHPNSKYFTLDGKITINGVIQAI